MPKVSVILTSYNHARFLRASIDSVLAQSYADFELIIWDDASTDESASIISQYSDARIRCFFNEAQRGPVYGTNKAIAEVAVGEFIAIHHSDDIWMPDKLEKQVAYLQHNPDVAAVFTHAAVIDDNGAAFKHAGHPYAEVFQQENRSRFAWLRHFLMTGNALCHPSVLIRKSCHDACGLYDDRFYQADDLHMWIRVCAAHEIHIIAEPLVKFRVQSEERNMSGNRPDSRIRYAIEYYEMLKAYTGIFSGEDIFRIFPEYRHYARGEHTDAAYVLARILLEAGNSSGRNLVALGILFEIANDPSRMAALEQHYGFSRKDFIALKGRHEVFNEETISRLRHKLDSLRNPAVRMIRKQSGKVFNRCRPIINFFKRKSARF